MARIFGIFLFTFFAIGQSNCQNMTELTTNKFAVNFYNQLAAEPNNLGKSLFFSPYSIQMVGALLYAGAGGKTASEMVTGFNLPSSDPNAVGEMFKNSLDNYFKNSSLFKIANKIYVSPKYTIAPTYAEIVTNSYKSEIENLDFEKKDSFDTVNKWIADKTGGKIQNMLTDISPNALLVLVNAIHFKGNWQYKFDETKTEVKDFYTTPNEVIKVEMMETKGTFRTEHTRDLGAFLVELPFKDSDVSMLILMPDSDEKSLDEIEAKLSDLILKNDIFSRLFRVPSSQTILLPKFKTEYGTNLIDILKKLSVTSLFETDANLQNILTEALQLYVSKAVHKAAIEVNEEGAEAAAATVMEAQNKSSPGPKAPININRSFLYFIKGGKGEIYFMGRFTGK